MEAQLEAIGRQFSGWHAWLDEDNRLFCAQYRDDPSETIKTLRLGHLLIRVAVRDAQIRAMLSQPARLTAKRPRHSDRRARRGLTPNKEGL